MKKNINKFLPVIYFIVFLLIFTGWYILVKLIEHDFNSLLLIVGLIYLIFNILVFGNLNINKDKKANESIRKDVKIFIIVSKISIFLLTFLSIYLLYLFYIKLDNFIYILSPALLIGGFVYLYIYLAMSLEDSIKYHKKLNSSDIIVPIVLMIIGIISLYFIPNIFNINVINLLK